MRTQQMLTSLVIALTLSIHTSSANELTVATTDIPQVYQLDATIEALNAGTLSAQTSGVIKAMYGDVNHNVNKGDLLVEIDDIQQKAAVAQAEASLVQAKALNDDAQATLKRSARLHKQGTLSKGEYDHAVAQAKSAAANVQAVKAALAQANAQLSYTRVVAPYAGIVMERFVEAGELVSPGQPLMSGYNTSEMRAVIDLPQHLAQQFNDSEQIQLIINGSTFPATETILYPFANAKIHSVRLRATLPVDAAKQVIPGQWVKVLLATAQRQGIALPSAAIMQRGELTAAYVRIEERTYLRQIRVGNTFVKDGQTWQEVLSGINEGDIVFDNALEQLAQVAGEQGE